MNERGAAGIEDGALTAGPKVVVSRPVLSRNRNDARVAQAESAPHPLLHRDERGDSTLSAEGGDAFEHGRRSRRVDHLGAGALHHLRQGVDRGAHVPQRAI